MKDESVGLPPHYSRNRQQMYQRILNDSVVYPLYLSQSAVALLDLLLRKNPEERPTAAEIRRHPFLDGINWDDLYNRRVEPPYVPDCRISHFDPEYTTMRVTWSEGDDTHEANLRSQSFVESFPPADTDDDSSCQGRNETSRATAEQAPSNGTSLKAKRRSGLSKVRENAQSRLNLVKDWKSGLELFMGYAYSRDIAPSSLNSSPEHAGSQNAAERHGTGKKKAFSIQARSLRGESNEPDPGIVIEDSNRSGGEEQGNCAAATAVPHPLLYEEFKKRCASAGRLRVKDMMMMRTKVRFGPGAVSPTRIGGVSTFARKLAQYETCNLIKGENSKITSGIIKLNDELHCVVSERKRGTTNRPPSPTRARVSLRRGAASPKSAKRRTNPAAIRDSSVLWTVDNQVSDQQNSMSVMRKAAACVKVQLRQKRGASSAGKSGFNPQVKAVNLGLLRGSSMARYNNVRSPSPTAVLRERLITSP